MLLTKECDYGIRIIRALSSGSKKTIEVIADEEKISHKYAYKIIKKLVKAGFINSTRGRIGGYHIKLPLNKIRLLDVIAAVDTDRYVNVCLKQGAACSYRDSGAHTCTVHEELMRIQDVINMELSRRTMDEILKIKG